jgi:hypothetical protein
MSGRDWNTTHLGLCPACQNVANHEAATQSAHFMGQYGIFAFLLLVAWCGSILLSFFTVFGWIPPPYSWMSFAILILLPLWAVFSKFHFLLRTSCAFGTVMIFAGLDVLA